MPLLNLGPIEIHYEVHGQGDPLLLIHGLGSSSRDWEFQIPEFSDRFKTIAIDLRGHGTSGKPRGPYNLDMFGSDTAQFMRAIDISSAHILGVSLGGMVAFQLALDNPELVRSLVIVNSVPELIAHNLNDRIRYWQRILITRLFGMEKMGRVLADRFFNEPEQEGIREIFVQRWAENYKPSYLASLKAAYGWSVLDRLGEIQTPTLVIGSDGDYFPTAEKEHYTRLMSNAELVIIENAKHALPAEKPAEFNRTVLNFLSNLP